MPTFTASYSVQVEELSNVRNSFKFNEEKLVANYNFSNVFLTENLYTINLLFNNTGIIENLVNVRNSYTVLYNYLSSLNINYNINYEDLAKFNAANVLNTEYWNKFTNNFSLCHEYLKNVGIINNTVLVELLSSLTNNQTFPVAWTYIPQISLKSAGLWVLDSKDILYKLESNPVKWSIVDPNSDEVNFK